VLYIRGEDIVASIYILYNNFNIIILLNY